MMLRTEGDFIRASNMSYDLAAVVSTYLQLHRKYINHHNGVSVPDKDFAITFLPTKQERFISVALHWTDTRSWTETLYYDTDSDYFQESMGGADNSCGEVSHSEDYPRSSYISIPISHLMVNEAAMTDWFVKKRQAITLEKAEVERVKRVAQLEAELRGLKNEV